MQFDISPENAQFLQDQVAAGQYANGAQAVNAAVEVLKRHTELRAKVQLGLRQLDEGQYVELDEEGMDQFFQELFAIADGARSSQ